MNNSLIPTSNSRAVELSRRESRALARQLGGLEQFKTVELARLEVEAQLSAAQVEVVGYVGQQAMQAITMVSQLELQLAEACPLAMGRLQGIADMTALTMAQVVANTARRTGR